MAKSYAIFGLGSFGTKLALELSRAGNSVLVCDISTPRVEALRDEVTEVVIADVTNEETIHELNVRKFDAVILGMSSFFEKQILALTILKQEGARRILAKATSDIQERILYRLGADEVIQPDRVVAHTLSRRLAVADISDMFEFKGSAIAEATVTNHLAGRSLKELNLRGKYGVTILLLQKPNCAEEIQPGPDTILEIGDILTVFGNQKSIVDLFKEK